MNLAYNRRVWEKIREWIRELILDFKGNEVEIVSLKKILVARGIKILVTIPSPLEHLIYTAIYYFY